MATHRNHANPINIAPFVDILLILFVILIVVARFDGGQLESAYQDLKIKYETLDEEHKLLVSKSNIKNESNKVEIKIPKAIEPEVSGLDKKIVELNEQITKEKTSSLAKTKELEAKEKELKNVKERMKKSGVHILVEGSEIYLFNPGTQEKLLPLSEKNVRDIYKSLTGTSMQYLYNPRDVQTLDTLKKIGFKGEADE